MRQLILFRHAKALPSDPGGDHARGLSERGHAEAAQAAASLATRVQPQLVLVSDARRTLETFDHVAEAVGPAVRQRVEPGLYGADPAEIAAVVARVDPAVERLLVIGHNPGIGDLARALSGTGDEADQGRLQARFPTAAYAVIDLPWSSWFEDGPGSLGAFVTVDPAGGSD